MPHHVYTTAALVISSRSDSERDKFYKLLTRDLGLIGATARGVRRPAARLQGILNDLSLVEVSLVRGKNSWRVTTAKLLENLSSRLRPRREALQALARVLNLVEKLVQGEEIHREFFDDLRAAALDLGEAEPEAWEVYTVSKLLYHLGYLSREELPKSYAEALQNKKRLVALINSGIRQSGL